MLELIVTNWFYCKKFCC